MKIVVTGSLGNIGKELTNQLVKAGNKVIVVTSSSNRKAAIEATGAIPAIGSVNDAVFLTETFKDADAVFAMTPPNLGGSNVVENTVAAGKAFAKAFTDAGIQRVVLLSSIGADLPNGNGPIESLYHIENIYNEVKNVDFTFLRAGYFYTNYYNDIPVIKGAGIVGSNLPASTRIPLVHPRDIASAAAAFLQKTSAGEKIHYIVSDFRSAEEVAKALGTAVGKPELPWVEFTDEQALEGMTNAGVPAEIAGLYTDMGAGLRKGNIQADFIKNNAPVEGKTKLEEFAKEFAARFNG
ncbi:NmrA family NAD(P)-binding protein [Gynurincola endophyticus]|uniref:NmrA family NAD(P)-binding protein n=1 Tax=Gynurincola endophyticus TaxID=2479004 RepID=UPI000F8DA030|nr:NmrA family NAD(P)-binding protein [Gynurincola endophyticus]